MLPVLREERGQASETGRSLLKRAKTLLIREPSLVGDHNQPCLDQTLSEFSSLGVVYQYRLKLQNIWAKSTATQKELLESLQEWCRQAEASGISALREFVKTLKGYVPRSEPQL